MADSGEQNMGDEPASCAGCKQPMLDVDGKPRSRRSVMHCCSHCSEPVHSPTLCKEVWMPITGGRDFCCKDHLLEFNAAQADEKDKLPVRRLSPDLMPEDDPEPKPDKASLPENTSQQGGAGGGVPGTAAGLGNTGCEPQLSQAQPPDVNIPPEPGLNGADGGSNASGVVEGNAGAGKGDENAGSVGGQGVIATPAALPFALGARVQMNFKTPSNPSWYGGVVGAVGAGGAHLGFDDGELRFFSTEEAAGLWEVGMLKAQIEACGLVDNRTVAQKADRCTFLKEGRMPAPLVVGVLVGTHKHNLAGLKVHFAHYLDTELFDAKDAARDAAQQTRLRSAAHISSAIKPDRKGYHTFRCGDVVQSTESETVGMVATVFGVVIAQVGKQLRRMLILVEMTGDTCSKSSFFVSSWTAWARMPPAELPEPANFDADDVETDVQAAESDNISKMIKVWDDEKPLDRLKTVNAALHAIQSAPPSFVASRAMAEKVEKAAKAAKAAVTAKQARKAAAAAAAAARNNRPSAPSPPPPGGIEDKPTAGGPTAPSNALPPDSKPLAPLPQPDSNRLADMRAKILLLTAQQQEEAELVRQIAELERAAAQREAMRERLLQLTQQQMQAPSVMRESLATPTPTPQQHMPTSAQPSALPPGPATPASSSGNNSTTLLATPTALTTPESEKALARRHRMLVSAQMIEPNVLRAAEIAGVEFDLEDKKVTRKRKEAARY